LITQNCPLCNSVTKLYTSLRNAKNYFRCEVCFLIAMDRNQILDIDEEKKRYDFHENDLNDNRYKNYIENKLELIFYPYCDNKKNVLDFGCGKDEPIKKILGNGNFIVDSYDKFYFPDKVWENKKYDAILMIEVIEHLLNLKDEIERILNSLNGNSILGISTEFYPVDKNEFENWWYIKDLTHVSLFSIETFKFIANEYNLKILNYGKNWIVLGNG